MDLETIRQHCLSFPHATENIQWGADLVFKIGGKMFAVACVEAPAAHVMSFKATPEMFEQLTERAGIVPAPYLARAKWVALERFDALPPAELKRLVRTSYDLVFATLTKKLRTELS
ncbi:MAG TPA: MmcQ/YjbR family DNA-binding protein [Blastocatellia bacterium]|nr:MmcQ/YjbR family DNA-binding protein [Blastocatellia bacterium]